MKKWLKEKTGLDKQKIYWNLMNGIFCFICIVSLYLLIYLLAWLFSFISCFTFLIIAAVLGLFVIVASVIDDIRIHKIIQNSERKND